MKHSAPFTPSERTLRARIGAYSLHAQRDPSETTRAARAVFNARFEQLVDPEGTLSPAERVRRADSARRAHMTRLALRSSKARRQKAERRRPQATPVPDDGGSRRGSDGAVL